MRMACGLEKDVPGSEKRKAEKKVSARKDRNHFDRRTKKNECLQKFEHKSSIIHKLFGADVSNSLLQL